MRPQIEMQYLDKLAKWLSVKERKPFSSEETKKILKDAKAYGCPSIKEKDRLEELIKIFEEYAEMYNRVTERGFAIDEEVERMSYLNRILSHVYREVRVNRIMLDEICQKEAAFP